MLERLELVDNRKKSTHNVRTESMTDQDRTIRDLSRAERDLVIRTFAHAIGAASALEKARASKSVMAPEDFVALLSLTEWPPTETTAIELAWLSKPIPEGECQELNGYSVFWASADDGFQIWIGRTPFRPSDKYAYLRNDEIMLAIIETYRVYLSPKHRRTHRLALLHWQIKRALLPVLVLLVAPAIMTGIFLEGQEWRLQNLSIVHFSPIMVYVVASIAGYFAGRPHAATPVRVIYCLSMLIGAAFLTLKLDDSSDIEIIDIIGIAASGAVGYWATMWKNWGLLWLTGREVMDERFRSTYTIMATWAVVAATGYGAFQVLKYAIKGAFSEGHISLFFLIAVIVFALGEFLRSQIEQ